jgi:hypothetical protein
VFAIFDSVVGSLHRDDSFNHTTAKETAQFVKAMLLGKGVRTCLFISIDKGQISVINKPVASNNCQATIGIICCGLCIFFNDKDTVVLLFTDKSRHCCSVSKSTCRIGVVKCEYADFLAFNINTPQGFDVIN